MALYVLQSTTTKKIFAISESKYSIKLFYLQNGYDKSTYIITKINDETLINKILVTKANLYLIDYYNFVIREKDKKILDNILYDNISLIEQTIQNLNSINSEYIMSPKSHNMIYKVCKILQSNKHKHNILKFINYMQQLKLYTRKKWKNSKSNEKALNINKIY